MSKQQERWRVRIAQEAARIIAEEGVRDFYRAKRKAIARLAIRHHCDLPTNLEIQNALREFHTIFTPMFSEQLIHLRNTASHVMQLLADYDPHLTGPVLEGVANHNSAIIIHTFSDTMEEVLQALMSLNIPFRQTDKIYRLDTQQLKIPAFVFLAEDVAVEIHAFGAHERFQAPTSVVDGKPMRRANLQSVKKLQATA